MSSLNLSKFPIHLGPGTAATAEPEFTGAMDWYEDYARRHEEDGEQGRLLSMHSASVSWTHWEMHPLGPEVVICTEGEVVLVLEEGPETTPEITLTPGQYHIIPAGVWHTLNTNGPATLLFVTSGKNTEHRPRTD